jgi:glyoxylase-like metal-dependent hydrolase (beta-lactamase superfamily II)
VYRLATGRGVLASNVHLVRSGSSWALVDTGWAGSSSTIRGAAESVLGPGGHPVAILLTHIHPDHSPAAGRLARAWGVPVYVHPGELPMASGRYPQQFANPLDRWFLGPAMRLLPSAVRARMAAAGSITDVVRPLPPDRTVPGLPGWEWIPTPGHTPGHVAYRRPGDGVLLTGDAALTVDLNSVSGVLTGRREPGFPPRYTTWDWAEARRSVAALAALEPRVLLPGHGPPLSVGAAEALQTLVRRPGGVRQRRVEALLRPLGDSREGAYRPPPPWYARLQWLGLALTRLGLTPRDVLTLEVRGRTSGRVRRTNVVQAELGRDRYLVSLTGESQWVRNVRAAGGRVVLGRRHRYAATLVEVPPSDRAPVLRAWLHRPGRRPGSRRVAGDARVLFGVGPAATVEELAGVAHRHPVFRVVRGRPPTGAQDRPSAEGPDLEGRSARGAGDSTA